MQVFGAMAQAVDLEWVDAASCSVQVFGKNEFELQKAMRMLLVRSSSSAAGLLDLIMIVETGETSQSPVCLETSRLQQQTG